MRPVTQAWWPHSRDSIPPYAAPLHHEAAAAQARSIHIILAVIAPAPAAIASRCHGLRGGWRGGTEGGRDPPAGGLGVALQATGLHGSVGAKGGIPPT